MADKQKTTTKTQSGINDTLDGLFTQTAPPIINPSSPQVQIDHAVASKQSTKQKVAAVTIPEHNFVINVAEVDISQEHIIIDHDEGWEPVPVTPETLPAVIKHSMEVTTGEQVDIEWHMVKHLPGYVSRVIRAIGHKVFEPFTNTAIEKIQVIANLGGSGPNSDQEIDVVSRHLSHIGTVNTVAELYFQRVIEGYSAQVVAYDCEGYTFLLVKDFAGSYIYSWPIADSKQQWVATDRISVIIT